MRSKQTWQVGLILILASLLGPPSEAALATDRLLVPPKSTERKPNIIFILADDLGYGDLGCYGQKKIQTPNLDRMAAEGMRFTQCYAGSCASAPSRASLLTGLHTGHGHIRGSGSEPLRAEDITVAEILQSAGYRTCALGEWGLGLTGSTGVPNLQGFGEWLGYLSLQHAQDYYPTQLFRNERVYTLDRNRDGAKEVYSHDLFTKVATNYIALQRDFPFFLYLACALPRANTGLKEKGMEIPSDAPYTSENWPQSEKNKAAMISRLDADVGTLLYRLRELKLDTNTVVFFSSANGPHQDGGINPAFFSSPGPFRGLKRDLYEGGLRVPMIVLWPGHIPRGLVSDQVWAFWDFLPTAAEIAGTKSPKPVDGFSFLPTLLGRRQTNQHDLLYWEFHEGGSKQAARWNDWKALRSAPNQPIALYQLKTDPAESQDVAREHPEFMAKFEEWFKGARSTSERWPLLTPEEWKQRKPAGPGWE